MIERHPHRRPTHPGEVLREDVLPPLDMTVDAFALRLKLPPTEVADILAERAPVTPDFAGRLARLLDSGPELWLRMQQDVDVWEILHHPERYAEIHPLARQAAFQPAPTVL